MELRNYFSYVTTQHEMQPLYLFDQNYPTNAPQLLEDYEVPKYFPEDFFGIVGAAFLSASVFLFLFPGEDDRPPYRWILVGPSGSGVPFHLDPRGTSAWNSIIHGKKRYAIPSVVAQAVDSFAVGLSIHRKCIRQALDRTTKITITRQRLSSGT